MQLYDGTEDRQALAEIGVSDAEYWQGREDDEGWTQAPSEVCEHGYLLDEPCPICDMEGW